MLKFTLSQLAVENEGPSGNIGVLFLRLGRINSKRFAPQIYFRKPFPISYPLNFVVFEGAESESDVHQTYCLDKTKKKCKNKKNFELLGKLIWYRVIGKVELLHKGGITRGYFHQFTLSPLAVENERSST